MSGICFTSHDVYKNPFWGSLWTRTPVSSSKSRAHCHQDKWQGCTWARKVLLTWNRLPAISPAEMGLFRIRKELQFSISNHPDGVRGPTHYGKVKAFIEGKRKWRGLWQTEPRLFTGWILARGRGVFLPLGLPYSCRRWELPLLVAQFYLIQGSVYSPFKCPHCELLSFLCFFFTLSHPPWSRVGQNRIHLWGKRSVFSWPGSKERRIRWEIFMCLRYATIR